MVLERGPSNIRTEHVSTQSGEIMMTEQEQELLQTQQLGSLTKIITAEKIEADATDQLQDMYCSLREVYDPQEEALKIAKKEIDEVAEQLLSALDQANDEKVDGIRKTVNWLLSFTAKRKSTEITDKKKLIEILGLEAYLAISTVGITEMKKYLTPAQVKQVSTELYSGKRTLKYAKNI